MTRAAHFPIQIELDLPVIEHHGELGATRVKVEPTGCAVVRESGNIFLTCIAIARVVPRWPREELERALGVERVEDRRGRYGTMHVEIEIAHGALVARPYAYLLASVTLEWDFCVLKLELVLGVAEVGYLIVFHGFWIAIS